MKSKRMKYVGGLVLIIILAYNSVYFKSLDEVKAASDLKTFDATATAEKLYRNELLSRADTAIDLSKLLTLLKERPDETFNRYSNSLAIGNVRYFLVKGEGTIKSIADDGIVMSLHGDSHGDVRLATEFIYGNAIRDASGLVQLDDFINSADLNALSESINTIVRKEVLPPFVATVQIGRDVSFSGAIELNQKHLNLASLEVLPVRLSLLN